MIRNETRPTDNEFEALVASAHSSIHREMRRSGRKRVRRAVLGGAVAVVVVGSGAAVATATGLLGGVESSATQTADFDLGPAPKGSTYVQVTVDVTCQPEARYEIDLDHAENRASMTCGKNDDEPSQLAYEMELLDDAPEHTLTVTTNVKRKYNMRAYYRTGLTSNQKYEAERQTQEAQREENAQTVKRTDEVPSSDPFNHPAVWPAPYYVNENGMTIGKFDRATTPYDQWPDLEPSLGPGGERGFLLTEDGSGVKNPKEAGAYMKRLRESGRLGPGNRSYAVYFAKDGKTVLARYDGGKRISNP